MNEVGTREDGMSVLKGAMLDCESDRVEIPVRHYQVNGLYAREVTIPAGTLIVSARHKTEHLFILSKGKVRVVSEFERSVVYEAPHTGVTMPGTERALYAEEESVWTTFHATEETDIEKICDALVEPAETPKLEQWRDSLPKVEGEKSCHS